jgi:homoserine kinase type II
MLGSRVTALIDWYFACTDLAAYDLAVTETAWAFDGDALAPARADALREGYESVRPLSSEERDAHALLARGACLRFFLTRAQDWLDRPPNALVTAKDPMIYHRRLQHYRG